VSSTDTPWARIEPRWITLHGDRVCYRLAGDGPLLLLVHGLAGSGETWKHVMPALAGRFTVLAPDLLGQGQSDRPPATYSLSFFAAMLRDLMDALAFERATVVGQSLGGGVALQLAHDFPERCERLVLVNSGGFGRSLTFYLRMLSVPGFESVFPLFCSPWIQTAGDRLNGWLERSGRKPSPASEEIWRSYASLVDPDRRRAFFRSLGDVINSDGQAQSAIGRLHSGIHLPTLIVWGAEDPFIPVEQAHVAQQAIPGSRLEIFDGVGHYPHCERPERFVALLLDFVASTTPARLPPRSSTT
jgi:pimeloyl-ACP methyl ester carboxylesterase